MTNPYIDYYKNQAGSSLVAFEGTKYQRGHGFFGSLFRNILKPLGLYLGKQALSTGVNIGRDVLESENLSSSVKKRLKSTGKNMLNDSIERAQKFAQTGKGTKRRRRRQRTRIKKLKISKKVNKSKKKKSVKKKRRNRKQQRILF